MKQITFRITDNEFKKIEELSIKENRTKASLVRHYLLKKLGEIEDDSEPITVF